MRFEKVSLNQFIKDYAKCRYYDETKYFNEEKLEEIKSIWENIKLPQRSTEHSIGYDFYMPYSQFFSSFGETLVPTGIRFECDDDKFLMCLPSSGLGFKNFIKISNNIGIISNNGCNLNDEGHILCNVDCKYSFNLEQGEVLMQGVIIPYFKIDDDSSDGVRDDGLGSTGV